MVANRFTGEMPTVKADPKNFGPANDVLQLVSPVSASDISRKKIPSDKYRTVDATTDNGSFVVVCARTSGGKNGCV
jgi:hypothetical protein